MRLYIFALLLLFPQQQSRIQRHLKELARTTGTIVGTVVFADNNTPLEHVFVSGSYIGDETDKHGHFKIIYQKPGLDKVLAYRRDMLWATVEVRVAAGKTTSVKIEMRRAPRARFNLEGTWHIRMILDTMLVVDRYHPRPTARSITGSITFDRLPRAKRDELSSNIEDNTVDESGRYNINLRPFFGDEFYRAPSTSASVSRRWNSMLTKASGYVFHGDSVMISLIPGMADFGVSLEGQGTADSVAGRWYRCEYGPSTFGHFVMWRKKP